MRNVSDFLKRCRASYLGRRRVYRGVIVLTVLAGFYAFAALSLPFLRTPRAKAALGRKLAGVEIGGLQQDIESRAGHPDLVCPGGASLHALPHVTGFFGSDERVLEELFTRTKERWIYFLPGFPWSEEEHGRCLPAYGDADLGFDREGRLLWAVLSTGESYVSR